jgi:hypothetical protein
LGDTTKAFLALRQEGNFFDHTQKLVGLNPGFFLKTFKPLRFFLGLFDQPKFGANDRKKGTWPASLLLRALQG